MEPICHHHQVIYSSIGTTGNGCLLVWLGTGLACPAVCGVLSASQQQQQLPAGSRRSLCHMPLLPYKAAYPAVDPLFCRRPHALRYGYTAVLLWLPPCPPSHHPHARYMYRRSFATAHHLMRLFRQQQQALEDLQVTLPRRHPGPPRYRLALPCCRPNLTRCRLTRPLRARLRRPACRQPLPCCCRRTRGHSQHRRGAAVVFPQLSDHLQPGSSSNSSSTSAVGCGVLLLRRDR